MADQLSPLDGLGQEDMALPEIKLVQALGGDEAKAAGADPGDFYCSVTGTVLAGATGVELMIVRIAKNRTYWGRSELTDEPPTCASHDGLTNLNGEPCDPCPYGVRSDTAWMLDAKERREKCNVSYNILAINLYDMLPVMVRGSGVSATPVRELITMLSANREIKGEFHRVKVLMTSQPKTTAYGPTWAIKFRMIEMITDPVMATDLKAMSAQLRGVTLLAEGVPSAAAEIKQPEPETPKTASVPIAPAKQTAQAARPAAIPAKTIPPEHAASPPLDF